MKFYLFATNVEWGDPVKETFEDLMKLEDYLLNNASDLDCIQIIKGEEMKFDVKVEWK